MLHKATCVYYTSNREDEQFEQKIRERLLATIGELPLISVSQKPIDFGKNICVGDVGVSNQNVFRQLQIGAQEAKTDFIISVEADCLYPTEHFRFIPPVTDECFRNNHLYILFSTLQGGFWQKSYSECTQICGREYLIRSIDEYLHGKSMWNDVLEHGPQARKLFGIRRWKYFNTSVPVINVKTADGMHRRTGTIPGTETPELPQWGKAEDMRKELFDAKHTGAHQ